MRQENRQANIYFLNINEIETGSTADLRFSNKIKIIHMSSNAHRKLIQIKKNIETLCICTLYII